MSLVGLALTSPGLNVDRHEIRTDCLIIHAHSAESGSPCRAAVRSPIRFTADMSERQATFHMAAASLSGSRPGVSVGCFRIGDRDRGLALGRFGRYSVVSLKLARSASLDRGIFSSSRASRIWRPVIIVSSPLGIRTSIFCVWLERGETLEKGCSLGDHDPGNTR